MKQILLFFGLFISLSTYSQIFSGSLNAGCNGTNSNFAIHDLIAPRDSRLELTGGFNVTGGPCSGDGSANVTFSISAYAIWIDENGDETQQLIAATGNFSGDIQTVITNTVPQGMLIRVYLYMSVQNGQYANATYTFNPVFPNFAYAPDNEPNNTYLEAINTTEGTFYEGHGTMDVITPETADNDQDWYKITAPRNCTLTIYTNSDTLIPDNYSTNIYAMRSDINGFTMYANGSYYLTQMSTSSGSNGNFNTIINCVQQGDIIYLTYSGNSNSYRFLWGISEPNGFIDNEPNDLEDNAIAINDGETKTGNLGYGLTINADFSSTEDVDDWYTFTMPYNGDIDINISADGSINTLSNSFYIEDNNGDLVGMPLNGSQEDGYFGTCFSAGTYYFKLNINPDNSNSATQNGGCEGCCLTYSLTLNLSNLQTSINDIEPNNTINEAEFAIANIDYEGQLGAIVANGTDNQDIYELSMDYNGDLDINFVEPFPQGNAYLTTFNGSFQGLIGTTNLDVNNMITSISYSCAAAGESYYLYLYAAECSTYKFNYTNTYYGDNNEIEPNNTFVDAQILNDSDTIFGQLNYGGLVFIDSIDYYELNITESAPVSIDFLLEDNTYVTLYEDSGTVASVYQTSSSGPIESLTFNNTDASKNYFIEITNNSGNCINYELLGWSQGFTTNNDTEPNNSQTEATAINFNEIYEGQLNYVVNTLDTQDFYSFILNEQDDIEFILNAYEGLVNTAVLQVYNSNGNEVFSLTHDGTNSSRTSNITNLNAGSYYIIISGTDQTGSYEFNVVPQNTLSSNTVDLENLITIYPIPAKEQITIEMHENFDLIFGSIYDVTGKLISTIKLKSSINNLDISAFENGIYFIKINTKNTFTTKRFIKQ